MSRGINTPEYSTKIPWYYKGPGICGFSEEKKYIEPPTVMPPVKSLNVNAILYYTKGIQIPPSYVYTQKNSFGSQPDKLCFGIFTIAHCENTEN